MSVSDSVREFPLSPGVYIMRNDQGKIIYVGKAKSLRKRVSQYFLPGRDVKTAALVSHIASIEYIVTGSEYEALILENNLIKKNQPRYNIDLKDDKTYQMIKITDEDYPRVLKTRKRCDDGAKYYGPFPKGRDLDVFYGMLENTFSFRRCKGVLKKLKNPCLYYHIGKCSAPCTELADKSEYRNEIFRIEHLLEGNSKPFEAEIEKKMNAAAKNLDFENAMKEKELLMAVRKIANSQTVGNVEAGENRDYIAAVKIESYVSVQIMQFRRGNLLGASCYHVETFAEIEDILVNFLLQYYNSSSDLPDSVCLSFEIDRKLVERYFSTNFRNIEFMYPKDGKDCRITEMAKANAEDDIRKHLRRKGKNAEATLPVAETTEDYSKRDLVSILMTIPTLGEKKARDIAAVYGSISGLLEDSAEKIAAKTGISVNLAQLVRNKLKL